MDPTKIHTVDLDSSCRELSNDGLKIVVARFAGKLILCVHILEEQSICNAARTKSESTMRRLCGGNGGHGQLKAARNGLFGKILKLSGFWLEMIVLGYIIPTFPLLALVFLMKVGYN